MKPVLTAVAYLVAHNPAAQEMLLSELGSSDPALVALSTIPKIRSLAYDRYTNNEDARASWDPNGPWERYEDPALLTTFLLAGPRLKKPTIDTWARATKLAFEDGHPETFLWLVYSAENQARWVQRMFNDLWDRIAQAGLHSMKNGDAVPYAHRLHAAVAAAVAGEERLLQSLQVPSPLYTSFFRNMGIPLDDPALIASIVTIERYRMALKVLPWHLTYVDESRARALTTRLQQAFDHATQAFWRQLRHLKAEQVWLGALARLRAEYPDGSGYLPQVEASSETTTVDLVAALEMVTSPV